MDDYVFTKLTDDQKAEFIALRTLVNKITDTDVPDIKEAMSELREGDEDLCVKSAQIILNYISYLTTLYKLPTGVFQDLTIFK